MKPSHCLIWCKLKAVMFFWFNSVQSKFTALMYTNRDRFTHLQGVVSFIDNNFTALKTSREAFCTLCESKTVLVFIKRQSHCWILDLFMLIKAFIWGFYQRVYSIMSLKLPSCCSECCFALFHSDVHMYMGQPPVYSAVPGSMGPADVQSYQNAASVPGPAPGMTQTPNYSTASGPSIAPSSDVSQAPYSEKALL